MRACPERNAAPLSPRPSGRAALIETFTFRVVSAVGPATAAMSRKSLSGLARLMVVEVNFPPFAAASHTISNSCVRDLARMIASLVALRAPNMRFNLRKARSLPLRAASRSKLSSAYEMFADMRSSSETIWPSSEPASRRVTSSTPTLRPLQISGNAAAAPTCASHAPFRQASERVSFRKSLLTVSF